MAETCQKLKQIKRRWVIQNRTTIQNPSKYKTHALAHVVDPPIQGQIGAQNVNTGTSHIRRVCQF